MREVNLFIDKRVFATEENINKKTLKKVNFLPFLTVACLRVI